MFSSQDPVPMVYDPDNILIALLWTMNLCAIFKHNRFVRFVTSIKTEKNDLTPAPEYLNLAI